MEPAINTIFFVSFAIEMHKGKQCSVLRKSSIGFPNFLKIIRRNYQVSDVIK